MLNLALLKSPVSLAFSGNATHATGAVLREASRADSRDFAKEKGLESFLSPASISFFVLQHATGAVLRTWRRAERIVLILQRRKTLNFRSSSQDPEESFGKCGSIDKNKAMVESLRRYGIVNSKKVIEVMETVDRGLFVPSDTQAYIDSPMQIGYNATISAPHMHATCLELLEQHLQPGMRALDVGSGTGYLTACFAIMIGSQGFSVGLEHIPELASFSVGSITKSEASSLLKEGSLSIHVSDGRFGWSELAPYDAIHVGAAALEIPEALIQQLKPGGRMVIPVGTVFQDLKVVDKTIDGSIRIRSEASVRYVPLTSKDNQLRG